jgi:hypothetical protein
VNSKEGILDIIRGRARTQPACRPSGFVFRASRCRKPSEPKSTSGLPRVTQKLPNLRLATEQIPNYRQRSDQQHREDNSRADLAHSRTSYSNATPSRSFSSHHFSAASGFANTLT